MSSRSTRRSAAVGEAARCSLTVRVMRGQTVLAQQLDPRWSAEVAAVSAPPWRCRRLLGEPERWCRSAGSTTQAVAVKLRAWARRRGGGAHQVHRCGARVAAAGQRAAARGPLVCADVDPAASD
jgi:hypothetical protein